MGCSYFLPEGVESTSNSKEEVGRTTKLNILSYWMKKLKQLMRWLPSRTLSLTAVKLKERQKLLTYFCRCGVAWLSKCRPWVTDRIGYQAQICCFRELREHTFKSPPYSKTCQRNNFASCFTQKAANCCYCWTLPDWIRWIRRRVMLFGTKNNFIDMIVKLHALCHSQPDSQNTSSGYSYY